MKNNILITGPPRCGKSTLMEKIVERIDLPAIGFFTREIRAQGRRTGFSITTLDGRKGILAHKDIKGRFRVGKYGVNLEDIDSIAVPSMMPAKEDEVVVIDEIGKMECFSIKFKEALTRVLEVPNWVIGSIAQKGGAFIQGIKEREDVTVIDVTPQNRDILVHELLNFITYMQG
jgi:nucleoside-triphosphatase